MADEVLSEEYTTDGGTRRRVRYMTPEEDDECLHRVEEEYRRGSWEETGYEVISEVQVETATSTLFRH